MSKAPRSLAGNIVAITGGARGIGRATAAALILQGARVAIGDIDAALAEQTARELGAGTIGLPLDVTDRASFDSFLTEVEQQLGPLDVVINNAGIMAVGPLLEETDAMAARMIDINLRGVLFGSKLALQRFLPRGRGHLVNIASSAGKTGIPGGATYCATKHAVVGLSEAIRGEYRPSGIEVSVVMPVGVNTELYSGLAAPRGFKTAEPEHVANAIVEALQTGRFEVYVPKSLGPTLRLRALMSTRASDLMARLFKTDKVLLSANLGTRNAYQQRIAEVQAAAAEAQAPVVPAPPAEPTVAAREPETALSETAQSETAQSETAESETAQPETV